MISPEQLIELSNFLNALADLPVKIQEIADTLKAQISPVQESAPVETVEPSPEVSVVEEVPNTVADSATVESNG